MRYLEREGKTDDGRIFEILLVLLLYCSTQRWVLHRLQNKTDFVLMNLFCHKKGNIIQKTTKIIDFYYFHLYHRAVLKQDHY